MRRLLYLVIALTGCASASQEQAGIDANGGGGEDSGSTGSDGSQMMPDAGMDMPDAPPCNMVTRDLLVNGNFDLSPIGNGWTEIPINAAYPLVTADDGVTEQSAPNKAWLGGFELANSSDTLYQDVAIPASTTMLVLSGYYDVRTGETGTVVNDTGRADIVMTNNSPIENVLSLDNVHPQTAWVPFNHTVTTNVAGQTIRIRFTTLSNATLPTSFYFDTLALQATYCE